MKNNYPNLYISEIFLDSLDKKLEEVRSHSLLDFNNSNKRKSLDRIIDLFFIGNIYSDIEEYKIEQFRKKSLNDYKFKDVLLKKIIEEDSNKRIFEKGLKRNDCKLSNFCFFIDKNHEDCENLSQTEGKIIIGDDFLNSSFYLEQTFAAESTNKEIKQVDKIKHPCSSMLIIDQYLFEQNKIPYLIKFLEKIISPELSKPFELDILIGIEKSEKYITDKYEEILNAFSNKISLHILNDKSAFDIGKESDRFIITNYSTISIGHPFDRPTSISCNFYPSNYSKEGIITSYSMWKDKIFFAKKRIESTPEKILYNKVKWKSDDIKHSIFESV